MPTQFNPNLLSPDDKTWIENVNQDFDALITIWISAQKRGELTVDDVIKVTTKVAELRGDDSLIDTIRHRMGLS